MSLPLSLHCLRPCALELAATRNAACRRVYRCSQSRRIVRNLSTTLRTTAKDGVPAEETDSWAARSAAISARIQELRHGDALTYPRLRERPGYTSIPSFIRKYNEVTSDSPSLEEVVLCGRLRSIRRASSKLVFLDLVGEFEHVQGLCNFRKLETTGITLGHFKELSRLIKRGDIVSVTGTAIRTPTGELTVEATRLPELLSPSLVPLPTKLVDEDTKIQNRHIDLLVNRSTSDVLRLRSYIIKYMRDFFHERDFLEFQTPILAENAGGALARPFATSSTEFNSRSLALRIAPELWLKRLVVGGVEKVFEIGPAFRNEGVDTTHNPEFTMCEFYNAYANLPGLIRQTEDFLSGLARHCQDLISTKLSSLPPIDLDRFASPYKQLEFIPALEAAIGFTLPDLAAETALQDLQSLLQKHNIPIALESPSSPSSSLSSHKAAVTLPKLLDKLAGTYLEPHSAHGPLFITHHPACMSPLSKSFSCPATGQLVSARAELFVRDRELANMYEEENDPFAQRRKFVEQARRRDPEEGFVRGVGDDADDILIDEGYIQALESGLPPTGGWGCGVERLVMLFSGARRISDCLSFGSLRNVVGLSTGIRRRDT